MTRVCALCSAADWKYKLALQSSWGCTTPTFGTSAVLWAQRRGVCSELWYTERKRQRDWQLVAGHLARELMAWSRVGDVAGQGWRCNWQYDSLPEDIVLYRP